MSLVGWSDKDRVLALIFIILGVLAVLFVMFASSVSLREGEAMRSIAARYGFSRMGFIGNGVEFIVERSGWGGTLRGYDRGLRTFATTSFYGRLAVPRRSFCLTLKWTIRDRGPGTKVHLTNEEIRKRFVVFAEQHEGLDAFFDEEISYLLDDLYAGLTLILVKQYPDITIQVQGADLSVWIEGKKSLEEDEHVGRVLALIEHIATHAPPA